MGVRSVSDIKMNTVDGFLTEYSHYATPNYGKYVVYGAIVLVLVGCVAYVIVKRE